MDQNHLFGLKRAKVLELESHQATKSLSIIDNKDCYNKLVITDDDAKIAPQLRDYLKQILLTCSLTQRVE